MLKTFLFSLVLLVVFVQPAQGAMFFNWQQIDTENFRVYFPAGLEEQANQAAEIAEEVHVELTEFLSYEPKKKTDLILYAQRDTAGGWADISWDRRIGIYLGHFNLEGGFGEYESMLRLIIAHEYAHILQLSLPPENLLPWGWLSQIFPPILLQPYWFIEGFAMTVETDLTEGGRADSPIIGAMLRAQADADEMYHFDQIQGLYNLESWPGAMAAYNYGAWFMAYLIDVYGENLIVDLARKYPENPLRGISGWFNYLTGDNLQEVYLEWQDKLDSIGRVEQPETITSAWGYNQNIATCPQTDRVLYFHQGELFPSLRLSDGEKDEQVLAVAGINGGRPTWSPDGEKIAFARLRPEGLKEMYHQIFIFDLDTGEQKQVTSGRGGRHPAWSSQGELAYVENLMGGNQIVLYDVETGQKETLFFSRPEIDYGSLAWDPAGEKLAIEVWIEGGARGIWIYDTKSGYLETLFAREGNFHRPVWSASGSFLYTVGSIGGPPQIFAYNLESDRFWQVTSNPYGTFDIGPGIEKDFFVVLTSRGYQIKEEKIGLEEWLPRQLTRFVPREDEELREMREVRRSSRNYPLFSRLTPRLVIPWSGEGVVGVNMFGWDPLQLVYYEASIVSGLPIAPAYNIYTGIYPDQGRFGLIETLLQGGWTSRVGPVEYENPRRFDGGQFLLHIPVQREYLSAGTLRLGGGAYFLPDMVYPGVHLGWTQQFIRGQDRLNVNFAYALDGSTWYVEGWDTQLIGQGLMRISPWRGSSIGLSTLAGVAPGDYQVSTSMRSFSAPLQGELIWLNRVEFTQRILDIKRGRGEIPIFLDSLQARPYFEAGSAWAGDIQLNRYGGGLEGILDVELLQGRIPLELVGGVSYNTEENLRAYFRFNLGGFVRTIGEKYFSSPVEQDNLKPDRDQQ